MIVLLTILFLLVYGLLGVWLLGEVGDVDSEEDILSQYMRMMY